MRVLSVLLCGAVAAASEGFDTTYHPYHPHARVVGGVVVQQGSHRYVAGLKNHSEAKTFCGAALVAPDMLLTAAHCLRGAKFASIGTRDAVGSNGGEIIAVQETIPHPQYNSTGRLDYDVAFVKLKNKAKTVQPVAISYDPIPPSSILTVRGWGDMYEGSKKGSDLLLEVQLKLWDNAKCSQALNRTLYSSMFCAGGEIGKDSCQSDSGGPIVLESKAKSPLLVGVVSWGIGCGQENKPGVYARLSDPKIVEFIKYYLSGNF